MGIKSVFQHLHYITYDRIGKEMNLTQKTYFYMCVTYKHSIFTAVLYCIVYV